MARQLRVLIVMRQTSEAFSTHGHPEASTAPLICEILMRAGFAVELCNTLDRINRSEMSGFDVIVFNSKNEQKNDEVVRVLNEFVTKDAKGMIIVHNASASFADYDNTTDAWIDLIGSAYVYARDGQPALSGLDGPARRLVVTVEDAKHPIMAGVPPSFELPEEELFKDMRISQMPHGQGMVLAVGHHPASDIHPESISRPLLFCLDNKYHGYGRVVHLYVGHFISTYENGDIQKILLQGVEWAASRR